MTTMPLAAEEHELRVAHQEETHLAHHEGEHDHAGINRMGLWLFMASESMLFFAMAAARLYLNGFNGPDKGEVNIGLGIALTVILLASSWLGYQATGAIERGNRRRAMTALLLASLLGIVFIGGVAVEWRTAEFSQNSPFGTAFFSMTGLHVFHLITGLIGLLLAANLLRRGQFGPGDHWGITAVVRYWTFVDVMWLAIVFPMLYLL